MTSPEPPVLAGSRVLRSRELHETAEKFLHCANRAAEFCWNNTDYDNCVTSKAKAERALYDSLRDETDNLHANLVQKAIRRAVEVARTCASLLISQNFVLAKW